MKDKTKEQLINELVEMRRRITELKKSETERKQAEEALQEREAFNFALFQYNPMETIVVDLEGRVVKSNLAKKASGDRLPNIGDVMYKDYAGRHEINMYAELMKCIRSGKVREFPEQKYGERFLSIIISPFPQGAIIISRDITERKQAEEALERQDKERMDFINALIHEIKTPLTAMVASSKLLKKELLADSSLLYDLAKNLDTAIHNLNRRISELTEFAKLQSTELVLFLQPVDIYQLAQDIAAQVSTLLQNKDQTLSLELPTSLPRVEADPDRVVQVLLNLLTNASKFSPPNSEICLQAYQVDTQLILEVHDCAPPIGPKEAKLIFNPYYLGKEAGGVGLGLSICKRLVELQGGKIWVEIQDKGNSFKFSLPLVSKLGDRT